MKTAPAVALTCIGQFKFVKLAVDGTRSPTTTSALGKQSNGVASNAA